MSQLVDPRILHQNTGLQRAKRSLTTNRDSAVLGNLEDRQAATRGASIVVPAFRGNAPRGTPAEVTRSGMGMANAVLSHPMTTAGLVRGTTKSTKGRKPEKMPMTTSLFVSFVTFVVQPARVEPRIRRIERISAIRLIRATGWLVVEAKRSPQPFAKSA
jgi:hypothetical protein